MAIQIRLNKYYYWKDRQDTAVYLGTATNPKRDRIIDVIHHLETRKKKADHTIRKLKKLLKGKPIN